MYLETWGNFPMSCQFSGSFFQIFETPITPYFFRKTAARLSVEPKIPKECWFAAQLFAHHKSLKFLSNSFSLRFFSLNIYHGSKTQAWILGVFPGWGNSLHCVLWLKRFEEPRQVFINTVLFVWFYFEWTLSFQENVLLLKQSAGWTVMTSKLREIIGRELSYRLGVGVWDV